MTNSHRGRLARSVSLLTLTVAFLAAPAGAQQAAEEPVLVLDTIVLTGEKIDRDRKQTASSFTVITGEEIEKEHPGKNEVRTVIAGTPNVIYADSVSTPIIRGQNTEGPHTGANAFFAGSVPRATINLDGHYLSYNEFYFGGTSTWDVKSIEVFRGPQTTTQGANAIAGAIIVNTNDPTFTPEGAYQFEIGNYNQRRASLAWSGPINDQLAARIALDYGSRDTFIDYVGQSFIQNDIGQDFKTANGRVKLLWVPTDIPGLEAKLTYSHSYMTRPSAEGSGPPYDRLESITTWMPGWEQTTDTAILDVNYDLSNGLKLSNQAQYSNSDVKRRVGTPTAGDADIGQDNYTNETKLTYGEAGDVLSGVAGVYTAYTSQDETLNQGGISSFKDRKHNLGVYGELTWRFDPRWTLSGGLRYERDHIRRTGEVVPTFANSDVDYDQTFTEVLPKVSLSYDVTPDWTVGAMYSKGYNPGGVSLDFYSSKEWEKFDAETINNYELFTRANLIDNRLFVTGNLFYMDYRNAQQSIAQTINSTTYIHMINADKAKSYGLELGVDYLPTDALTLRASTGLLHTKFTKFSDATDYEGNEFARAPGKMLSLSAMWDVNDRLTVGGQFRYIEGYYSDTSNTPTYAIGDYGLTDINASYRITDTVEVYGYVNNLFDKRTPVLLEAARGDVVFTQGSMTAPRMVGIGIRGRF